MIKALALVTAWDESSEGDLSLVIQTAVGYLLIETPDGLITVDWKTDAVASEADVDAKLATYELQGAAYAVAIE